MSLCCFLSHCQLSTCW